MNGYMSHCILNCDEEEEEQAALSLCLWHL